MDRAIRPASLCAAFLAAAIAIGALLAYPLRDAGAYLDDHVFLALGRHLDNPLVLLVQDSLGGFFFRPLGMLLWWASVAALGDHAGWHAALNIALHVANGLLVFALLRRLSVSVACAAAGALLFIAHPAAFAAAAWLSDRFDLFAALFGFAALLAAERYLQEPRPLSFACAVAAALASMACKETGVGLVAVAALMAAWTLPAHKAGRGGRIALVLAMALCALALIAARSFVLRDVAHLILMKQGMAATLWGGGTAWLAKLPAFLVVMHGSAAAVVAWLAAFAALIALPLRPHVRARLREARLARIVAIGIVMMLATAALQAPIMNHQPVHAFAPGRFEFDALAACRLYYVPLAGFALVIGALLEAFASEWVAMPRATKVAAAALGFAALVGLVVTGRAIGREWVAFVERGSATYVRAAVAAVRALPGAAPGCKVYFLETPDSAYAFRTTADTAVKQTLPKGHPAAGCFIQSEHSPWFHLVTGSAPGREKPLRTMLFRGRAFEPLTLGNLTYYFLVVPDSADVRDDPNASFHAYDGEHFRDVTAEVRSRRRSVRFVDNRPPL